MIKLSALSLLSGALFLSGCQTTSSEVAKPAVLSEISPAVYAKIQLAIESLQGGDKPSLSKSVFTKSSELTLEVGTVDLTEKQKLGLTAPREMKNFQLQLRGKQCGVLSGQTNQFVPINKAKCNLYKAANQ